MFQLKANVKWFMCLAIGLFIALQIFHPPSQLRFNTFDDDTVVLYPPHTSRDESNNSFRDPSRYLYIGDSIARQIALCSISLLNSTSTADLSPHKYWYIL